MIVIAMWLAVLFGLINLLGLIAIAIHVGSRIDTMGESFRHLTLQVRGAVAQRQGIEIDAAQARKTSDENRAKLGLIERWVSRHDPMWDRVR